MCVIEAENACAAPIVQGKAIAQTMRSLRASRHNPDDESDRVIPARVDRKRLTVKLEQDLKAGIALIHPSFNISSNDNLFKRVETRRNHPHRLCTQSFQIASIDAVAF
jgi:hypothetical protein